jgi:LysR family transcriptional regulator, transcriptional activator of nhaA
LKTFGSAGTGLFFAPTVVESDVKRTYDVDVIGRIPEVQERFYAISVARRLTHPAVTAILEAARKSLFAELAMNAGN